MLTSLAQLLLWHLLFAIRAALNMPLTCFNLTDIGRNFYYWGSGESFGANAGSSNCAKA
jgi:hypothetical protein